ncbi:MAG: hypothetical protein P4L90_19215 [Rhodopila sp.]|nr:hypothetical protein [Rhodopila sp.]
MTDRGETGARADDRVRALAHDVIRDLYDSLLDRSPGERELLDWVAALLGGVTLKDIRRAFVESDEYQERVKRQALVRFVEDSGLFDAAWYLAAYPDVAETGVEPLTHYCANGMSEGRAPNAYMAPFWYQARFGINALADVFWHYVTEGEREDLPPGPDFDPAWYRAVHGLADDVSALAHFLAHRHTPWVAPCGRLWSVWGLERSDEAAAGSDPFAAFLRDRAAPESSASADAAILSATGVFDENFYALHSNDVLEAGMPPLEHFCRFGWWEGRNPNFYFSVRWYLDTNPQVRALEVNPLVHYILKGERSYRRPVVYFSPDWYYSRYDLPRGTSALAHYLANRRTQRFSPNPLFDPAWYMAQDGVRLHPSRDAFPHFLAAGMGRDVRPSEGFDMTFWRQRLCGRPSRHFTRPLSPERDNPLVLHLASCYN